MSLDPLLKIFLDQAAQFPRPNAWEIPVAVLRRNFAGMMELVGPKDVPVGGIQNYTIRSPSGFLPARAYAPAGAGNSTLPLLLYFHGGGFVVGDLDSHDGLCRLLVREGGFRVIAIDYRLAPEHKWPAPLEDAKAAFSWAIENAPGLGVDTGRIAVGGDSAGGLITACLTQALKEKKPGIAFQLLLFPGTDPAGHFASMEKFAAGYFIDKATIEWNLSQVLSPGVDPVAAGICPLRAGNFSGLPPAHVQVAGCDPFHDEGLAYAQKLKDAGVNVAVADAGGMVHCFIYLQAVLPQALLAVASAAKAVRDGLARV